MNAGGAVLVVFGAWVVVQVIGGRALQRLGVIHDPTSSISTEMNPDGSNPLYGVTVPGGDPNGTVSSGDKAFLDGPPGDPSFKDYTGANAGPA